MCYFAAFYVYQGKKWKIIDVYNKDYAYILLELYLSKLLLFRKSSVCFIVKLMLHVATLVNRIAIYAADFPFYFLKFCLVSMREDLSLKP